MEPVTIFWLMLFIGFFFALISALFVGFGHEMGGHDFDYSAGHDFGVGGHDVNPTGSDLDTMSGFHGHGEIALSPISPITIATFIGGFGGGGVITHFIYNNLALEIVIALVVGLLLAYLLWYIVSRVALAIQGSSEAKVGELIGEIAEVITPIQGEKMGEISYVFKGSRYNAPARSVDGNDINKNMPVKIWRVIGSTFYVKQILPEESNFPPEGKPTSTL